MNDKDKIDLLTKVFDNQQTLISYTDTKSNIALGVQTFLTTSVLGTSMIVDTFSSVSNQNWIITSSYYTLFITFLVTSVLGLTFCILVFKPRLPQEKKELKRKGITYFGHIVKYKNSVEYLEAIDEIKTEDIVKEFSLQNYNLSIILERKMKYVKLSTTLLLINILLGITLLIFALSIK
jgi:hypothetical protein